MSNAIKVISTEATVSFLILDGGEYYSCILPRQDVPAFVEAIRLILPLDNAGVESSAFETSHMKVDIHDLGEVLYIEGVAIEGPAKFRMTLERENVLGVVSALEEILKESDIDSPKLSFGWILGYTADIEIS